MGDRLRIGRVLWFLTRRVVEATQSGVIAIYGSHLGAQGKLDNVHLAISTTEVLIEDAIHQDPFQAVSGEGDVSETVFEIAKAKYLIAKMGGELVIESEASMGTLYSITCPMERLGITELKHDGAVRNVPAPIAMFSKPQIQPPSPSIIE